MFALSFAIVTPSVWQLRRRVRPSRLPFGNCRWLPISRTVAQVYIVEEQDWQCRWFKFKCKQLLPCEFALPRSGVSLSGFPGPFAERKCVWPFASFASCLAQLDNWAWTMCMHFFWWSDHDGLLKLCHRETIRPVRLIVCFGGVLLYLYVIDEDSISL